MQSKPRILLLSAYHTDSHRAWCNWLTSQLSEFHWTQISLPGRYFNWRIRGNPLSWINHPELNQSYDGMVVTSTVDLATLKGIFPMLSTIPTLYYVHENQFAYPKSSKQHQSIEPQMVQLYSLLAANRIAFNSRYNCQSCLDGINQLLKKFPDEVPGSLDERILDHSSILPVPIDASLNHEAVNHPSNQLQSVWPKIKIVWNHRWEYDKGPDSLLNIVRALDKSSLDFELTLLGKQFRSIPDEFSELLDRYPTHVKNPGFIESKQAYLECLADHHVVLSTAIHEFQGLAIQEAVSQGCLPLVPNNLAYPELFDDEFLYPVDTSAAKPESIEELIVKLGRWQKPEQRPRIPTLSNMTKDMIGPYKNLLNELISI